jgi:hypothetical protein
LAHERKTIRPAIADRIALTKGLLVLLLALFGGVRARASGLGFSFLLGRVALGIALVLLSFTLAHYVVTTGNSPADLFRLALDPFNDAFDAFFWTALVIAHGSILPLVMVELTLDAAKC